jgi:CRISPR/Cas system Type II protein with McrA/HNH and RuvC-like nuclease domain
MNTIKETGLNKEQYKNIIADLQKTGLQQDNFHEDLSWDDYVTELEHFADDDETLKRLIHMKSQENMINEITLTKIMASNFTTAKEYIDKMTIGKRIAILDEVYTYREYLYETVSRYGGEGLAKDKQLTASEFKIVMGRIKHLEILQNWLFGIM